jgi:hypothetical protein
VKTKRIEFSF